MLQSFMLSILIFCFGVSIVEPSQDDEHDFDKEFEDKFREMDQQDRFYEAVDEGFDNWENRCARTSGQEILDRWLEAQESLIYCVMQNFDFAEIQRDMEAKKQTGDLDQVFKKYCGEPVHRTRPCVRNFLAVSRHCLKPENRGSLNVTMAMVDGAVDFLCHGNGDRIALFMAENGMDCVKKHQVDIISCINSSFPEIFDAKRRSYYDLIVYNTGTCRKGEVIQYCVEKELLKCPDPTPANVVESLMSAVRKETPCRRISKYSSLSKAGSLVHGNTTKRLLVLIGLLISYRDYR